MHLNRVAPMAKQQSFPWTEAFPGTSRETGNTRRSKPSVSPFPTVSLPFPGTTGRVFPGGGGLSPPPRETLPGQLETKKHAAAGNTQAPIRFPAGHDVGALAARWLGAMPERAALRCLASDGRVVFYVTSSRSHWQALRRSRGIVFGLLELDALTYAVACDRVNPASLLTWCAYKQHAPAWRLTVSEALGSVNCKPDRDPYQLSIGAVLKAMGASLLAVEWPEATAP